MTRFFAGLAVIVALGAAVSSRAAAADLPNEANAPPSLRLRPALHAGDRGDRAIEPEREVRRACLGDDPARVIVDVAVRIARQQARHRRLGEAKKPETRTRRLAKFLTMLENGEKLH